MMRRTLRIAALLALPSLAAAQEQPRPATPAAPAPLPVPAVGPPIERVATATQMSAMPFGAITSVRELPDGRILVNDGQRRRLLMMDTTLQQVDVVLDSLSAVANTYGTRPGALLPYRGDSTLFVDPASLAMIVIDPQGRPIRVRSVWRAQDAGLVSSTFFGYPGLDANGRMVYRVQAMPEPPKVAPPAGIPWIPVEPDSTFLVAVDIETRDIDTIATLRIPKNDMRARRDAEGRIMIESVVNPLPLTDEWSVLPDGTLAIVRGIDYRVEYRNPDGSWTSSQKLPYEWQRMTDVDKERFSDSARVFMQKQAMSQWVNNVIRWVNQYNRDYPPTLAVPEGFTLNPGIPKDWILPPGVTFPENYVYACAPGQEPTAGAPMQMQMMMAGGGERTTIMGGAPPAGGPPGAATPGAPRPGGAAPGGAAPCMPAPITFSSGQTPPIPQPRAIHVLQGSDLPDYKPPFSTGSVRADLDGNLWIRANLVKPIPGGAIYDIVNRQGELVTRYQLPPGYTIVGFGRGKVVYLSMRDPTGLKLARVRLR